MNYRHPKILAVRVRPVPTCRAQAPKRDRNRKKILNISIKINGLRSSRISTRKILNIRCKRIPPMQSPNMPSTPQPQQNDIYTDPALADAKLDDPLANYLQKHWQQLVILAIIAAIIVYFYNGY